MLAQQMAPDRYAYNKKLRAIILTRGLKLYELGTLLDGAYAKNTISKWKSDAQPMPQRAWDLLSAKLGAM